MSGYDTNPLGMCGHCATPASLRPLRACEFCGAIAYCSGLCSNLDSRTHDVFCRIPELAQQRGPRDESYRAVIFPEQGGVPYFVWLPRRRGGLYDLTAYGLDADNCTIELVENLSFPHLTTTDRQLATQPLSLAYPRDQESEATRRRYGRNQSIRFDGVGCVCFDWRGPVVLFGARGDVCLRDLRFALDYIHAHQYNLGLMDPARFHGEKFGPLTLLVSSQQRREYVLRNTGREPPRDDAESVFLSRAMWDSVQRMARPIDLGARGGTDLAYYRIDPHDASLNAHGLVVALSDLVRRDVASIDVQIVRGWLRHGAYEGAVVVFRHGEVQLPVNDGAAVVLRHDAVPLPADEFLAWHDNAARVLRAIAQEEPTITRQALRANARRFFDIRR
ncbi:hypothetical protein B0T24DRAFT_686569 [Lasiosphaeria ovina]|uniref:MYND-type domain-containing protein n=1 Tax=Lasiosphaeria ovina TaxID=92902 RepID=A0AAE0TWY2_9PEZI|nr:hypothetical protein B0T24DRAFT_686569 [Lasiosphaeria ovina]